MARKHHGNREETAPGRIKIPGSHQITAERDHLHHLRDEDRMELIKRTGEIMTLHVNLNKRKKITTELEENNLALQRLDVWRRHWI